jgi:hypothetical protein
MQLKAFIKKKAVEKNISAQLVMQNYVLERLLERISLSPYKQNFILKGGFLISAIVGLDTRATMDLDTTIKGFDLSHEGIRTVLSDVLASKQMQGFWGKYQSEFDYAANISFETAVGAAKDIMTMLKGDE